MGLFKKKSAAEKQRKQEIKDAKKDARKDKKDARKDAREDKKDARQEARADKKEIRQDTRDAKKDARQDKRDAMKDIRQSDLSKSDKKDAKKDVRADKKDTIDLAKQEKKDTKHDIREDKRDSIQKAKADKRQTIDQIKADKRAALAALRVPKAARRKWVSYLRFQEVDALEIYRPKNLADIKTICRIATDQGLTIRALGSGHSFSEAAVSDDILIETKGYNRMLPMSQARRNKFKAPQRRRSHVELEVGRTIIDISKELEKTGRALANQGTYDGQTFWGAVSTSTHGSGTGRGPFPNMVKSLVMVGEGGRTYRIEPTDGITRARNWREAGIDELIQDDDVFYSVICSFGCMGVVYSAVIDTADFYWLNEWTYVSTWEIFKESFSDYATMRAFLDRWETASLLVSPVPAEGGEKKGVSLGGEHPISLTLRRETNDTRVIGGTFTDSLAKALESAKIITGKAPAEGRINITDFSKDDSWLGRQAATFGASRGWLGDEIRPSEHPIKRRNKCYKIFPKGGKFFGGYGTEIAFPIEQTIPAMDRILELTARNTRQGNYHTAPIAVRWVAPCAAYASPQFADRRDRIGAFDNGTVMFEVLMSKGTEDGAEALRLIEADLMDEPNMRLHWGLNLDVMDERNYDPASRFPQWPAFQATFQRFNQSGTFHNPLTDRLGLS
ncbi:MAG: FAD-binding protein [Pseudomonadota bacterium]